MATAVAAEIEHKLTWHDLIEACQQRIDRLQMTLHYFKVMEKHHQEIPVEFQHLHVRNIIRSYE